MTTTSAPPLADVALRPARPADAQAIWSVRTRAIRIAAATHYAEEVLDAWAGRMRPEGCLESMRTRRLIVAEAATAGGPRIVGFGQLEPSEGVIDAIYVDPDFGRRGIGAALFAALEREARALGLPGLTLEASLNSVPFYAAMGCRQECLDRHELAPGVHIACAVMDKRFAPPEARP
jgi:putative acetyltransferase